MEVNGLAAMILALCVGGCLAAPVSFNVTLSGVPVGYAPTLPIGWNLTVLSDTLVVSSGVCPAGRWCPAGSAVPSACPLGTYSNATGLSTSAAACAALCAAGNYCPDPGVSYRCSTGTTSLPGSTSQLGCMCVPGYTCAYAVSQQITVTLGIPVDAWISNATSQTQLLDVISASTNTGGAFATSVNTIDLVPVIGEGGVARRRMLGAVDTTQRALDPCAVPGSLACWEARLTRRGSGWRGATVVNL